jgi:hypothetical protein
MKVSRIRLFYCEAVAHQLPRNTYAALLTRVDLEMLTAAGSRKDGDGVYTRQLQLRGEAAAEERYCHC